ncbi:MAG: LPP20 family lipoprotein [Treponema sp.]|jgi:hypothetical protein|nr:LPP20 family lipoprotein [Treponema sp.]
MYKVNITRSIRRCLGAAFLWCAVGCGSGPASVAEAGGREDPGTAAEAAALAALASMDGGSSGASVSSAAPNSPAEDRGQAAAPAVNRNQGAVDSRGRPAWVNAPDSVYSPRVYVAAVGYGGERGTAEKAAFANLTALFGQSVQSEQIARTNYSQAVKNGAVSSWTENTELDNAIKTSAELDSLVGAEIKDYWYDGTSVHYAVAVMEKQKTAVLYADLIRSNEKIISSLTAMSAAEKNSLDGYARYRLAGTVADANRVFANVLTVVGSQGTGINPGDMKKGDDFRLEAANIAKSIPIGVKVNNDRSNRIRGAFSEAINRAGFRSGGADSRYVLNVDMELNPVDLPNNTNKFVRYVIDANLVDQNTKTVLLPYTVNGREGHLSVEEAKNRAVAGAERKIKDAYGSLLSEYVLTLVPAKK